MYLSISIILNDAFNKHTLIAMHFIGYETLLTV